MADRCAARPDRRCCPHAGIGRRICCYCLRVVSQMPVRRAPPAQQKPREPSIKAPRPHEYFLSDTIVDAYRETDERKHLANRLKG